MVYYSTDGEQFIYESIHDAIDSLVDDGVDPEDLIGATFGKANVRRAVGEDIAPRYIQDILVDIAFDEFGESSDNLDCEGGATFGDLDKIIRDWLDNNTNVSTFWTIVGKPEPVIVTKQYIDEYIKESTYDSV